MPPKPKKEPETSRQSSRSSSSQKSPSSAEIRAKEHDALILQLAESHFSPYNAAVLRLSPLVQVPADTLIYAILAVFLVLHLFLPVFLLPHWSALITLVVPVRCSLETIALELNRIDKSKTVPARYVGDTGQWLMYWILYAFLGFGRGWVGIWRPGCCGAYEVLRSMWLIVAGGGWFARKILHPVRPSDELEKTLAREKKEIAERQRAGVNEKRKEEREKAKKRQEEEKRAELDRTRRQLEKSTYEEQD